MATPLTDKKLAVLGAGKLGGILLRAYLKQGLFAAKNVTATVRHEEKAAALGKQLHIFGRDPRLLRVESRQGGNRTARLDSNNHLDQRLRTGRAPGEETRAPSARQHDREPAPPWSPQARGKLSRDWDYTSIRTETEEAFSRFFAKTDEADRKVADRVAEVAKARGVARAQIALAWLLAKPVITAPIVGATKLHHLDDAIASVDVKLSAEEVAALEAPYIPHAVVGFE